MQLSQPQLFHCAFFLVGNMYELHTVTAVP